jgi:hypothetical protein
MAIDRMYQFVEIQKDDTGTQWLSLSCSMFVGKDQECVCCNDEKSAAQYLLNHINGSSMRANASETRLANNILAGLE